MTGVAWARVAFAGGTGDAAGLGLPAFVGGCRGFVLRAVGYRYRRRVRCIAQSDRKCRGVLIGIGSVVRDE